MWPHAQETEDLVTFTEEIPDEKLYILCSDASETICLNFKIKAIAIFGRQIEM